MTASAQSEPDLDALQKAAIVVVGDPDPSLDHSAQWARTTLAGHVRFPTDATLEAALRGVDSPDDGLGRVRAERRGLGLDETADIATLVRLGRLAAADLLLLVRMSHAGPRVEVFNVDHAGYLSGTLTLDTAQPDSLIAFVRARTSEPSPTPLPPTVAPPTVAPLTAGGEGVSTPVSLAPTAATTTDPDTDGDEDANWFEEYWPLLVGGALLLGVIVWFALPSDSPTTQPTLRFVPGG